MNRLAEAGIGIGLGAGVGVGVGVGKGFGVGVGVGVGVIGAAGGKAPWKTVVPPHPLPSDKSAPAKKRLVAAIAARSTAMLPRKALNGVV